MGFFLLEFNYTIEHRKGFIMHHIDALSRQPICKIIQDAQATDDRI